MFRAGILSSIFLLMAIVVGACASPEQQDPAVYHSGDFEPKTFSTEYQEIRLTRVVDGLQFPWSLAFLPDARILVTEKPGRLSLLDGEELIQIDGVPNVLPVNQGGLLEVSVHPDFDDNGWIYLTYSEPAGEGNTYTALGRGRLVDYALEDFSVIFRQDRASDPGRHYGSRLAWAADGSLYMSIGDRGSNPPRAQDLNDHAGTLLRLNDDGTPYPDNPFTNRNDALPEIYSYGHRNIQGLVIDEKTGTIWATEHGPRGGDELNQIEAGNNYGWPVVTLGLDYASEGPFPDAETRTRDGMTDPIHEFLPTHSPSGLVLVTSDSFPNWQGNLLVGGLRGERIRRVVLGDGEVLHEEELIHSEIGRIRDIRQGPDGNLYLINDSAEAGVYRIEPN